MPTFNFATITAAQALGFTAADTLAIDQGSGPETTVLFNADGTTSLLVGTTTVVFSAAIANGTVTYADGSRLYIGSAGADTFGGSSLNDGIYGGAGNDSLTAGPGTNQMQGNTGNDILIGGPGRDVIYGGQDNDFINVGAGPSNFAQGNRGNDVLMGNSVSQDILLGGQGNDLIGAQGLGAATVEDGRTFYFSPVSFSGGGNDILIGNLGDDIIFSGNGDDSLNGEDGNDYISDFGGRNTVVGGEGADIMLISGNSTIDAGGGDDYLALRGGTFVVTMGDGNDYTEDFVDVATDRATIDGGAGNDTLQATSGQDSVSGGVGDDIIVGDVGADTLAGGAGSDLFGWFADDDPATLATIDMILDWASEDRITYVYEVNDDDVGLPAGTALNYTEGTAADFAAALNLANGQIAAGTVNYVSVQVGADVFLFADSLNNNGGADTAVRLVGRGLADIAFSNIILFGG